MYTAMRMLSFFRFIPLFLLSAVVLSGEQSSPQGNLSIRESVQPHIFSHVDLPGFSSYDISNGFARAYSPEAQMASAINDALWDKLLGLLNGKLSYFYLKITDIEADNGQYKVSAADLVISSKEVITEKGVFYRFTFFTDNDAILTFPIGGRLLVRGTIKSVSRMSVDRIRAGDAALFSGQCIDITLDNAKVSTCDLSAPDKFKSPEGRLSWREHVGTTKTLNRQNNKKKSTHAALSEKRDTLHKRMIVAEMMHCLGDMLVKCSMCKGIFIAPLNSGGKKKTCPLCKDEALCTAVRLYQ